MSVKKLAENWTEAAEAAERHNRAATAASGPGGGVAAAPGGPAGGGAPAQLLTDISLKLDVIGDRLPAPPPPGTAATEDRNFGG